MKNNNLLDICKFVRYWSVKLPTVAGSGHPTSSSSAVELMTVLMFSGLFKYDVENPDNKFNDHLIFSKGHASSLFYSLWHVAGVLSEKQLLSYRQFNSVLEGHPTRRFKYTEAATGSLGQGLAIGVGRALADINDNLSNKTYVLMGDSELAEGSVWEAATVAGFYRLNNIVAIIDVNKLGQRGETMTGYNLKAIGKRFESINWKVVYVKNGNSVDEVKKVYQSVLTKKQDGPLVIIAKTVKGCGIKNVAGKEGWHGKPLNQNEWLDQEKYLLPNNLNLKAFISCPQKSVIGNKKEKYKVKSATSSQLTSTRFAVAEALTSIAENKNLFFIDAEVGNSTGLERTKKIANNRFIQTYIAEQTMVGMALGLSLSKKKVVFSTFGAFLTRAYDQLRMAAYNQINALCIGTHAGVAIGQDGVSQMALEDISMFRSLFEAVVMQPADDVSAKKITEVAINYNGLCYIRALRQETPRLYTGKDTFKIGDLKILNDFKAGETLVLASGTTVHEALKAKQLMREQGINIGVVDVYCIKPLPIKKINELVARAGKVVIVEDHYQSGGLGEAVLGVVDNRNIPFVHLCVRVLPRSGSEKELLEYAKIDSTAIINAINKKDETK